MTAEQAREAGREARRKYYREWAKKNRDKVKAYQEKYWAKKAEEMATGEKMLKVRGIGER